MTTSPTLVPAGLAVRWLGTVDYRDAWEEQRRLHAAVLAGDVPDTVLLLEHPSVYTAGKRTRPEDRPADGTPVIDVDRGGQITWHGPGQLVGYPILALPGARAGQPVDVVAYVRRVEQFMIDVCAELGVATTRVEGRSGAWVPADPAPGATLPRDGALIDIAGISRGAGGRPDRKVGAVGIRVVRGVTLHGFALNCDPDLTAFDRIVPCGIRDAGVTSVSAELGRDVTVADALPVARRHLATLLG